MDLFVYTCLIILSIFVLWMIYQFIKEWPNYSRKGQKGRESGKSSKKNTERRG